AKTHKSEREPLTNAVNLLVAKTKHLNYSDAYKLVHQRFNVQHIDEIPYDVIPVAVEYVHHLIAMYSRAEKYKETEPHIHTVLRDKDVQFLMWYVPILGKFIKNEIYPALTAIQSSYAGRLSGLTSEAVCHANALNRKAIGYGLTLEHVGNKSPHDIEWYLAH
ncbi:TPA: ORF6N domain-containing protein, partial [Acinetobacter baumannii]|nr:ORF6N domain-containing protein [Acinetobacter baumannii]